MGSPDASFMEADLDRAEVDFRSPLVNIGLQEYHAASVFTSHVADILKTSVVVKLGRILP